MTIAEINAYVAKRDAEIARTIAAIAGPETRKAIRATFVRR